MQGMHHPTEACNSERTESPHSRRARPGPGPKSASLPANRALRPAPTNGPDAVGRPGVCVAPEDRSQKPRCIPTPCRCHPNPPDVREQLSQASHSARRSASAPLHVVTFTYCVTSNLAAVPILVLSEPRPVHQAPGVDGGPLLQFTRRPKCPTSSR